MGSGRNAPNPICYLNDTGIVGCPNASIRVSAAAAMATSVAAAWLLRDRTASPITRLHRQRCSTARGVLRLFRVDGCPMP
jgi:hypothetical protein